MLFDLGIPVESIDLARAAELLVEKRAKGPVVKKATRRRAGAQATKSATAAAAKGKKGKTGVNGKPGRAPRG